MSNCSAGWRRSIRLLWGGHFLSVAGLTALVPFLPMFLEEIGQREDVLFWSGFILAAPAISYALTAPLWGRLGDRIGRKWMVVRALFGLSVVLLAFGFVQSPVQLLALRLLQGVFGGVVDSGTAFAGSEAPEAERGKALGRLEGAAAAGAFAGPVLGGVLWGAMGFRPLFMLLGMLLFAWSLFAAFGLKESKREKKRAAEPAGVHLVIRDLLSDRKTAAFIFAGMTANFGAYGIVTVFAPHVNGMVHTTAEAALWIGILQGVTWAASWAASPWWGKRNDAYSVERNFAWAAAICGLAIALQAAALRPEWLIVLRLLQGFGFSALLQSVFFVICGKTAAADRGASVGSASSLLVMGQIAGPLTGGLLAGLFSPGIVFIHFGLLIGMGGMLALAASKAPNESKAKERKDEFGNRMDSKLET